MGWGNSSRLKMWLFEGHVKISGEDERKLERSPSESETYLIFAKLKKFKKYIKIKIKIKKEFSYSQNFQSPAYSRRKWLTTTI